ncbi:hypothetical protein FRC19_003584 [Serendipita sp. 401]|nr:hypothetical protein FRC19_003584 [Serendipita sp. 401]KAG9055269.1 hypothetical protein FS842_002668 [Serendipita sp. 407]
MSTSEQVNEQCRQLLSGLVNCVNSTLVQHNYGTSAGERESNLSSSDERLVLIRDTLKDLLSDIGSHRNRYAPISKLMDDVLLEIWSYTEMHDRLSVSQVCRKWRHVSLGATKLWTELDFDKTSTRALYRLLKRAGKSRLHITQMSTSSQPLMHLNAYPTEVQYHKDLGPCGHGCAHGMLNYPNAVRTAPSCPPILPPKLAFPLRHFNEIVQNSRLIQAFVKNDETAYVNHKTLALPMPHLQCLILSTAPRYAMCGFGGFGGLPLQIDSTLGHWENLKKWFDGVTPQLKEVYLTQINAPWEDRIYANLTHLQLNSPPNKVKPYQFLRILSRCPTMEYLDIVRCLSAAVPIPSPFINMGNLEERNDLQSTTIEQLPLVTLSKLWYLHFDEPDPEAFSTFLPRIVCPALESLTICASSMSSLVSFTQAMALHAMTLYSGPDRPDVNGAQPVEAFRSFFSRTANLKFSTCPSYQLTFIGGFAGALSCDNARWIRRGHSIEKCSVSGWSFSCNFGDLYPPHGRHHASETRPAPISFLDQAESLGVRYDQIELVDIAGHIDVGEAFYQDIFSRCLRLKVLKFHPRNAEVGDRSRRRPKNQKSYMTPKAVAEILTKVIKDNLCPELEQLQLKADFMHCTRELTQWLRSRARKHRKLKKVVVDGSQEQYLGPNFSVKFQGTLPERTRSQIEATLAGSDPSSGSEETGLIWEPPKQYILEGFSQPRDDKQADPEEQEYLDWVGKSNSEAALSHWGSPIDY